VSTWLQDGRHAVLISVQTSQVVLRSTQRIGYNAVVPNAEKSLQVAWRGNYKPAMLFVNITAGFFISTPADMIAPTGQAHTAECLACYVAGW
jgi:shikimate kinase